MTYDHAKSEAIKQAKEFGMNIYVGECAIYAISEDEFGEGDFIVGHRGVFDRLYPKLELYNGRLVGVASPDGSFFCNDIALVLAEFAKS